MGGSVLLVEDEENLASLVRAYLEQEGYGVVSAGSGAEALQTLETEPVRLVVLDLNLPDMDGLDVCRQIRTRSSVPVVMLTARDEEADRLAGLDAGRRRLHRQAVLAARARRAHEGGAAARRARTPTSELLVLGDVVLRRSAREVGVAGEPVELRPKEFDLLAYLMENRGAVLSRDLLLERVWGFDYAGGTRTVDVHVAQLRRKLGRPDLIRTIRGAGYKAVQP